jgi:hypothetical protein
LAQANEGWDELKQSLGNWSVFTKKTKMDAIQQRQEWRGLERRITSTYHHSTMLEEAINNMLGMIECLQSKIEA